MARQKGIIKIEGDLGGISFYQSIDGYMAREKTSLNGERIRTDPAFARTRENNAEFARAGQSGKLLRYALRSLYVGTADPRMTGRLNKEMSRVLKTDPSSLRGERTVANGTVELLEGFNFNKNAPLGSTLFAPYTAVIDRVAGTCTVNVPAFLPGKMVSTPEGASHFRLISGVARVNFETGDYGAGTAVSDEISATSVVPVQAQLVSQFPASTTDPLFLAFGIEFMQLVNGQQYPLNNGGYNALALVQVDGGNA